MPIGETHAEAIADSFDLTLDRLARTADRHSEDRRLNPKTRRVWADIRVTVQRIRPGVRSMMSRAKLADTA